MSFNRVSGLIVDQIITIVGNGHILRLAAELKRYGKDETEDLLFVPELVVKPANSREVSQILKLCDKNCIPVTTRAGGTGLSGGGSAGCRRYNIIHRKVK